MNSIKINPAHKGDFTAFAKKHGKSASAMAKIVMKNPDNYSPHVVKMANFAKNFSGKKAQVGIDNVQLQPNSSSNDNWSNITDNMQLNNLDIYNPMQGPILLNEPTTNVQNPAVPITRTNSDGSVGFFKNQKTGRYEQNPYVTNFNVLAGGVTGLANIISNNKLKNQEQVDVLHSLEPSYWEGTDAKGIAGPPAYTKYGGKYAVKRPYGGGPLTSEGAKEILLDGKVHGKKLTARQRKYFGYIAGGGTPKQAGGDQQQQISQYIAQQLQQGIDPQQIVQQLQQQGLSPQQASQMVQQVAQQLQQGQNQNSQMQAGGNSYAAKLEAANKEAKRFSISRNLLPGDNMHVDGIPQYIDSKTGLPYKPTPTRPLAYTVPSEIQLGDIFNEQGSYWYNDPKTGDPVDVDPTVLNLPRFRPANTNLGIATKQAGGRMAGPVEAEAGEIVQSGQGDFAKVSDQADRHEQGGVDLDNVSRVLEDTSDKRKDKASKELRISPEEMESLFGFKTKSSVSHSKAFELANEHYDKKRKEIKDNNKLINIKPRADKIAINSAKLNFKSLGDIPSQEDVYDALFMHQEAVKDITGIRDDGSIKRKGGMCKYQVGGSYEDNAKDLSGETDIATKGWRFIKRSGNKDFYRKPNGEVVAVPGTTVSNKQLSNFSVDDVLNQPKKYATFHRMMDGAPDDVKRKAAEDLLKNGKMPGRYINNPGTDYGYIPLPTDTEDQSLPTSVTEDQSTTTTPTLDTSVNVNPKFARQPTNNFFEPLYADEIAPAALGLIDSLNRSPELYNPVKFNQVKYKRLDPTAAINANQADYNAVSDELGNMNVGSGAAAANLSSLQGQKYAANNQIQGQYDNQNNQIENNETNYNTQVKDRQSVADAQTRGEYYRNVQLSREAQRQQRLKSIEDISRIIQMKRRQNNSGNLILKLSPAFNQKGEYNGYQFMPSLPPELGMAGEIPIVGGKTSSIKNRNSVTKTWTDAAGRVHKEVNFQ